MRNRWLALLCWKGKEMFHLAIENNLATGIQGKLTFFTGEWNEDDEAYFGRS